MIKSKLVKAGAGLVAISAATLLVGAPAYAGKAGSGGAGHSTFSLTNQTAKKLIGGCGNGSPIDIAATGTATAVISKAGVKFKLPVTGIVTADTGLTRIEHADSGFELSNSCYDIKFSAFYIQDLGDGTSDSGFDVLARNINDTEDGTPRTYDFSLDLTDANVTMTGKTTKVRGADLLLAPDGASEFDMLAGDPTGTTPFSSGDQIGKAQTFYRSV